MALAADRGRLEPGGGQLVSQAWIKGAIGTDHTNSKRYGSRLYLWEKDNSCYTYPIRQAEPPWGRRGGRIGF
jgi:hypothetical protein